MKNEKKILIATTEAVPFVKTGGLADVIGALPKALQKMGADVSIVMPKYRAIDEKKFKMKKVGSSFYVPMAGEMVEVTVKSTKMPGTKETVYLIECDKYFDREGLYGENGSDYSDNAERFALFSRAVIEMLKVMNLKPGVIHCNDWQTGMIPAYLKVIYSEDKFYENISTVMTIHNIAYQGIFPAETMERIGLPWDIFNADGVEFWGNVSYLKSGLVYADVISTVSQTYAKEIQSSEYGMGLEGLLAYRSNDLYGITNGIDYDSWNPQKDENIVSNYDESDLRGKSRNKKDLQKEHGFSTNNVPMIGMVSRIDDFKGFDLVINTMDKLMNNDIQMIILGTGEGKYEEMLRQMEEKFNDKLRVHTKFDNKMAHKIYAASDIFLMPSKFEPCGLSQLIALKYGSLPVVHKTGGLADTITDYMENPDTGNGFTFEKHSSDAMIDAVNRAVDTYSNKRKWNSIVKRSMLNDFSWKNSASKYMDLYEKSMEKRSAVTA